MGYILLFLFIIFFVWPLAKVIFTVWRIRRQTRKAFEQMMNQANAHRNAQNSYENRNEHRSQASKSKKIASDIGEYVRFEEVADETGSAKNHTASTSSTQRIEIEQQIEDIEWEELD